MNRVVRYVLLLALSFVMLFPFYWMIAGSMKPTEEAGRYPPTWWPELAQWETRGPLWDQIKSNYRDAWESPPGEMTFARYFQVSFWVSLWTTAAVLVTSSLAAYALARLRFRGRSFIFGAVLAILLVPPQILLIPDYLILERLGWLDRYEALIVPFSASVFAIFLLRQFFLTIPVDLWEAARMDGAGHFTFLRRVVMPAAAPVLSTIALLTFLGQWNALLWPLIVTTSPEMRTLMTGLQGLNEEMAAEPNLLMAAATFSMLPILLAFFLMQRLFIESLTRTGLKS